MPDDEEVLPPPARIGKRGQPLKQPERAPVWDSPASRLPALLRRRGHPVTNTASETLMSLAEQDPFVRLLLDYRDATKRGDTYGIEFATRHVGADGRIHASFHQIGAETGRMACSDPNLQNIPKLPAYRACFRPSPGRVLVKADYSQIEMRIAAQITQDPVMIAAYQAGEDLHTKTAAAVRGVDLAAVTPADRRHAKAVNFGMLFGMGAGGLVQYAKNTYDVTLTEAEAAVFINRFFATYPTVRAWQRRQGEGTDDPRTLGGRRRIGVTRYTERVNTPVQGTAADIVKLALARLWADRAHVPGAAVVLVVHDEILIECDTGEAAAVATWLTGHMEAAGAALLPDVPVVAEAQIMRDWSGAP
jgi:DNA polymerase-1